MKVLTREVLEPSKFTSKVWVIEIQVKGFPANSIISACTLLAGWDSINRYENAQSRRDLHVHKLIDLIFRSVVEHENGRSRISPHSFAIAEVSSSSKGDLAS